jgi:hypothetical protein
MDGYSSLGFAASWTANRRTPAAASNSGARITRARIADLEARLRIQRFGIAVRAGRLAIELDQQQVEAVAGAAQLSAHLRNSLGRL